MSGRERFVSMRIQIVMMLQHVFMVWVWKKREREKEEGLIKYGVLIMHHYERKAEGSENERE